MVTPDPRSQELPDRIEALFGPAQTRAGAVARRLIGLPVKDARELAVRSRCTIRPARIDGRTLVVTADYAPNRIDVETQDGIVVDIPALRESTEEPRD